MELPPLPAWAKTLQRRIRQRGLDFFILYGPGVRDLHPLGARRFGTMGQFLAEVMLGDRSAIVTYDRGAGIGFTDRDVENDFKSVLKAYDRVGGAAGRRPSPTSTPAGRRSSRPASRACTWRACSVTPKRAAPRSTRTPSRARRSA